MNSIEQFRKEPAWTPAEKKTARKAFDKAFERHSASIMAEAKRMMANAKAPCDIWRVHDYLSKHRSTVDRIYDYRYSVLLNVFARLLREGWLTEADLTGLQREKIKDIVSLANL
ncbi:MAG: hypothetical protein LAO19_11590 [Acidobacteriia bacterium]|nr:hypothetical protein [Terriglobia bacterium]